MHQRGGTGGWSRSFLDSSDDRERAAAGHFDFAVAAHHVDEFVQLFGVAGDFDGEAFGGGIDHAAAEDLGLLEDGGPALLRGADAQQHQFADDRRAPR